MSNSWVKVPDYYSQSTNALDFFFWFGYWGLTLILWIAILAATIALLVHVITGIFERLKG